MKRPFPSLWLKSVKLTGSNLVALVLFCQKRAAESKIAGPESRLPRREVCCQEVVRTGATTLIKGTWSGLAESGYPGFSPTIPSQPSACYRLPSCLLAGRV